METGSVDWLIDETAHAGPEHLDAGYVAGYEAKAGYDPMRDVEHLLAHGLDGASLVLDLGAGTGAFTRAVAPHVGRVIAVDVSPAMVEVLDQRIAAEGLDNVTVAEAGFVSYRHAGSLADAVFTRNALHQLPDFWKAIALRRIHGFLRPGGVLRLHDLIYDFEPSEAPQRFAAWMAGAVDDPARGYTADEFATHIRSEHSTFRWLFEPILARTGFDILDVDYRAGIYATYTFRRS